MRTKFVYKHAICSSLLLLLLVVFCAGTAWAELSPSQSEDPGLYVVDVGDVLAIVVYGEPTLSYDVLVAPDGTISYPFLGQHRVVGLTLSQIEERITQVLAELVRFPVVSVSVIPAQRDTIVVLGEVSVPGVYPVDDAITLLELVASAGGTTLNADLSGVKVYDSANIRRFDEAPIGEGGLLFEGEATANPMLYAGSIVYVPPLNVGEADEVFILGEVRHPGAYPMTPGRTVHLIELIARAGSTTELADTENVRIYRGGDITDFESAPIGVEGLLFEGEVTANPVLSAGTVVYVPPLDNDQPDEVFILGEVRHPGAYPITPGKTVRLIELIARAGSTTERADTENVRVYDGGDITDYESAPVGASGVLFSGDVARNIELEPGNIVFVPSMPDTIEVTVLGPVAAPGTYDVREGTRILNFLGMAGGLLFDADPSHIIVRRELTYDDPARRTAPTDDEVVILSVDFDKLLSGQASDTNYLLQDGDTIVVRPMIQVAVAGAVQTNGVLRLRSNARLSDAILASGGLLEQADDEHITLTRTVDGEQVVIPLNFRSVLEGGGNNIPLLDGDIIHVPRSERLVYVAGEVTRPGAYAAREGMRLIEMIFLAGGPTQQSDTDQIFIYDEEDNDVFTGPLSKNPPVYAGQTIVVPNTMMNVTVVGAASTTGRVEVPRGSRILDVIATVGGSLDPNVADWNTIQLFREVDDTAEMHVIDVAAVLKSPTHHNNTALQDGDIVFVPGRQVRQISVLGEVPRPGVYTLSANARLIDALAAAGGPADKAALNRVAVMAAGEQLEPHEVSLGRYDRLMPEDIDQNMLLSDGDVVIVPKSNRITWQELLTILSGVKLIQDIVGF